MSTATPIAADIDPKILDFFTPQTYQNNGYPHPEWTWLRNNDPVHWTESDYCDPTTLHQATLEFINRYCQLPEGMDVVAAYYIRLTWLCDAFSELPCTRRSEISMQLASCSGVPSSHTPLRAARTRPISPAFTSTSPKFMTHSATWNGRKDSMSAPW